MPGRSCRPINSRRACFGHSHQVEVTIQSSVILPNFNGAAWLPRSINALLQQKLLPDEIIIVDDGSTDDSARIVENFQRQHPFIRLIRHSGNKGAPAALNTGLAAARGEFVYCAAADDIVFPELLHTAIAALRQYPHAAFFCANVVLVQDGRILGFRPFLQPPKANAFFAPEQVWRMLEDIDNWAVGQSVVYRRQPLQDFGGFDEDLGSLCDSIVYRVLAARHGFYFSDCLAAAWEIRRDSISAQTATSPIQLPMMDKARTVLTQSLPPALQSYPAVFEQRLRFGMLRLLLASTRATSSSVSDLIGASAHEARVISFIGVTTRLSRCLILLWFAIRMRPFGFRALIVALINAAWQGQVRRRGALRSMRTVSGQLAQAN